MSNLLTLLSIMSRLPLFFDSFKCCYNEQVVVLYDHEMETEPCIVNAGYI